jgi:lipopolysaccharide transport system ATP-binding protein
MSSKEIVLSANGLSKCYQIYDKPVDRLLQGLFGTGNRKFYKEYWALQDVSVELRKGETLGIIGDNGAGKSTLLQMIAGTLSPTDGHIEVHGKVAAILELGAGFNPEFTGRENISLSASIYGLPDDLILERMGAIETFADIGDFINQPVKMYSSGMYVRLAFAIIAHVDADILIIDEALAVGDIFFTQKCMRFLRKFQEHGTLLFVSHDTSAVLNFCDRAIWLNEGELVMEGTAKEVVERYSRGSHTNKLIEKSLDTPNAQSTEIVEWQDDRIFSLDNTPLRNEIRVFKFERSNSVEGEKKYVEIVDAYFLDQSEKMRLAGIVGGKMTTLSVQCRAIEDIENLIVGFYLKDRLGQYLFGDNTYITFQDEPLAAIKGESFYAKFSFVMPTLSVGKYSIDIAVASGTQEANKTLQWIYDALVFDSLTSSHTLGLVGIPISRIQLSIST